MMATSKAILTPLKDIRVSSYQIPAFGRIPNTSIQRKPLIIYQSTFKQSASASTIEDHLSSVGVVIPQWRYTMFSQSHFHSTSHEVLCVAQGKAKLCFGGEENPKRVEPILEEGDVKCIGSLGWFQKDPVYGEEGPSLQFA